MNKLAPTILVVAAIAIFVGGAEPLAAQATFGTITGSVTDASGAVIPQVTVSVLNQATGVGRQAFHDERGNYEATHLNPGFYTVKVEASGFKRFENRDVRVQAQQAVRIDAQLEVGTVGSEVTVIAGAPVIETEAPTLSDVKTARQIRDLPLNTLNGFILNAFLFTTPTGYQTAGSKFAMGGARGTQLYYNIDGISANSPSFGVQNSPAEPSAESIAEMKFNLVNNKAEFGEVTTVTAITRSGQNELHGRLFEQNTTSAISARSFFASSKGQNIINDFGASIGGPIKRNKMFFFGTYEGFRQRVPAILTPSVPTLRMRGGDFSDLLVGSSPTVIRDPFTDQPFPGNIIPPALLSSVALKWQEMFFPKPNFGASNLTVSNFRGTYPQQTRQDQFDVRVDHYISGKNTIYGRYSYKRLQPKAIDSGVPPELAGYRFNVRTGGLLAISDTWTLSPNLINEFKFGYARGYNPRQGEIGGQALIDALGIQGLPRQAEDVINIPTVSITNFVSIFQVAQQYPGEKTFQFMDQLTWIKGGHTLKFGGEYRPQHANDYTTPSFGSYSFTNRFTGYSYSDFLLGLPQTSSVTYVRPPQAARLSFLSGFIQDDWRMSPRLTLSYGLRYEFDMPPVDETDTIANFDPASGSLVVPNSTVLSRNVSPLFPSSIPIITAADARLPERTLRVGDKNNIQPRLGFAFRPFSGNRTVLRGGYGIFNDDLGGDLFGQFYGGPFRVTQTFTNTITNGTPLLTFTRPLLGPGSLGSIDVSGIDPHLKNPFVQQWNFTVEQALTGSIGLRVSYIGTSGSQLIYGRNINQPLPSAVAFNQNRRPYPNYRNVTWRENGGNQIYHALSSEVNRRFLRGLEFQAAWTWAKTITDTDEVGITEGGPTLENAYDRRRERADAQFSPRHRFVSNMIWQLPFGRGRALLDRDGVANRIFGGWQLTVTYNAQTGEFFTPTFSGADPSNTQTIGGIPDRIGNGTVPSDQRSLDRWFDASAFASPPNGRFGNSGKNILVGPGRQALNLGVFKSFSLTERIALRLQATFTNALNHPNFGAPNTNISAPASVGTVRSVQTRDSGGPRQGLIAAFLSF